MGGHARLEERDHGFDDMSVTGRPANPPSPPPTAPIGGGDPTSPDGVVRAPIETAPFVELAGVLLREAEATPSPEAKAELLVRLGHLCWDVLDDPEAAERYATDPAAGGHPLALRLRAALLFARRDAGGLAKLQAEPLALKSGALQAHLSALCLMLGDVDRALAAARSATGAKEASADEAVRLEVARDVVRLALGARGAWRDLAEVGRKATPEEWELRVEHARVLIDGAQPAEKGDAELERNKRRASARDALALLDKGQKERGATRDAAAAELYVVDLALEALEVAHGDKRSAHAESFEALLRERLALLQPGGEQAADDAAATAYLLAQHVEAQKPQEALELLGGLAGEESFFGTRLAALGRRRMLLAQGAWAEVTAALERMAEQSEPSPPAAAYRRRAAELAEARLGDRERAEESLRRVRESHAGDVGVARALLRLGLARGELGGLAAVMEAAFRARADSHGCVALLAQHWASCLRELEGDLDAAIRLRREHRGKDGEGSADLDDLARLYRLHGDRMRLAATYRRAAEAAGDPRVAATYHAAAGAVHLAIGQLREAEEQLQIAVSAAPSDLFARAAQCLIYRKGARWQELVAALRATTGLVATESTRTSMLREIGRIATERLGDASEARTAYEAALAIDPEDTGALHALAKLCDEAQDWKRGVELRERAAKSAFGSPRSAAILLEIGEIQERHLGDEEAARAAYERTLEVDEAAIEAVRALARLHRKAKRTPELVEILRREIELTEEAPRQLALQLEIGRALDGSGDAAGALAAYRGALRVEPGSPAALQNIERICRRDGKWQVLAQVFQEATGDPKLATARNLRTLGDALEKLERLPDLAEVRRRTIDLIEDPKELARSARVLATLYEEKLGDVDAAARFYRRSFDADPEDVQAIRALQRILRAGSRAGELAEALDRELPHCNNQKRKVEILIELGDLCRGPLDRLEDAAKAYEAALALEDKHLGALRALFDVYTRLGRDRELSRTLDRTAAAVDDDASRAELQLRKAEMAEQRGDFDAAFGAYRDAFRLDPSNRTIFTSYERLCYRRERWRDAMDLYQGAIELVESGKSRAYRISDLYARRGQLQLQYLGQPGEAAASYLKVLEVDPDAEAAAKALEAIFSNQEDWRGLIRFYERRHELLGTVVPKGGAPASRDALRIDTIRRAARIAGTKLRDNGEQARLYGLLLQIDPASFEALEALERYYERTRDFAKLIDVLKTRLQLASGPDEQSPLLMRIANLAEEGLRDVDLAIEHYKKLLELKPGNREILDSLARIYESSERWAEFIDITRKQIRATTDRQAKALLYFKCGSVMEAKFNRDDDAILYYDAAIKTSSSCLPAVHGLRDLYLRRKDWRKVIETLEHEVRLWQEAKEQAGVYAHIGSIYGEHLAETERAIHYFEQALVVDPECLPANRALFDLYFSRGDWERAAPVAEALAQKATREGEPAERSEFYRKRGVVAEKSGDPRGASESYVIALEIRPENLLALDSLAGLCRRYPTAYDFAGTFRELEKIYRRQENHRGLARTLIVEGTLRLQQYDVEPAEEAFREAIALAPEDAGMAEPLVDLLVSLRRYGEAITTLEQVLGRTRGQDPPGRAQTYLRLADVRAECQSDHDSAIAALRELLRELPDHAEGRYHLAQELYVLGRFPEARAEIEKVIETSTAPDNMATAEELARYYFYLGRVLDAQGEAQAASSRYRRAAEYDPGYPPPQLALARRAAAHGDTRAAEALLGEAGQRARGGDAAVLLRGLAQIQLASGNRPAAIQSLRSVLELSQSGAGPDSDDCVNLAEAYAQAPETVGLAVQELVRVLERDLRHAPTYRLLVSIWDRLGERERVARVLSVLDLLGYAEEVERVFLGNLRQQRNTMSVRRHALSDAVRSEALVHEDARSPHAEMLAAVREQLAVVYPVSYFGEDVQPIAVGDDPALKILVQDSLRTFDVEVDVHLAKGVPGGVLALDAAGTTIQRPVVVVDRALAAQPEAERRFLLGRALDPIRGAYSVLLRLGRQQRGEVWAIVHELFRPEGERAQNAQDFAKLLPRKVAAAVKRLADQHGAAIATPDFDRITQGLLATADRAGLVACDDVAAAARVLVRLGGGELAAIGPSDGTAVALGAVPGGSDLVRYYLSDAYHRLRTALVEVAARA